MLDNSDIVSLPKPGGPLKPRIDAVQRKMQLQISRLEELHKNIKSKDEDIFYKLVTSIKENNIQFSNVLSIDLAKTRQVSRIISISRITLEKLVTKLSLVSDFGDLVIVLSPSMSAIKNLRSLLTPLLPEMEEELGVTSELLGGILVDAGQIGGYTINFETANEEAARLIDEASLNVEQRMKEEFPCTPDLPVIPSNL